MNLKNTSHVDLIGKMQSKAIHPILKHRHDHLKSAIGVSVVLQKTLKYVMPSKKKAFENARTGKNREYTDTISIQN